MSEDIDLTRCMDIIADRIVLHGCSFPKERCRLVNRHSKDSYGEWYFGIHTEAIDLDPATAMPIRAHVAVLYQFNVRFPRPHQIYAVCGLNNMARATVSNDNMVVDSHKWLSDKTGQIEKHRIVMDIDPACSLVNSLHNLRYRLIDAIADAGSYYNRVHRFHLSLDGFSSVEGLSHFSHI